MNREWFFKNGSRLYLGSLLLLLILVFVVLAGDQWWLAPLIPLVFIVAGNLKLTHGIMFNDGKVKLWNQFCSFMFNGLIIGYFISFLYAWANA